MLLMILSQSVWLETLGRAHVALVHFPIALLLAAGVVEAWGLVRRRREASGVTPGLLVAGTVAALLAGVTGWLHAGPGPRSSGVNLHLIVGLCAIGASTVALVGLWLRKPWVMRPMTLAAAGFVAAAGHFGGELTHGQGYLTELVFPSRPSQPAQVVAMNVSSDEAPLDPLVAQAQAQAHAQAQSEFDAKVRPILAANCYECHGPAKQSGALRMDSLMELHSGGKSGVVVVAGKSDESLLIQRVLGLGGKKRMPPDRPPLSDEQVAVLREWIDADRVAPAIVKPKWTPTIEPVRPKLASPIDQLLEPYYKSRGIKPAEAVEDRVYARRVYLDILGVLPSPAELSAFVADDHPDKRHRLVSKLLADDVRYAEHWMSFWNDALRNDYGGTGYIDGGRKQITQWLFDSLKSNLPYDKFVAQLVDPVPGSEGFTKGIVWRGEVSQSQRPELQAAQNIGQVFLGVNIKCASCHDSFINDWRLVDAYGMASVYAESPLEMYRCEKSIGETARAAFLYLQVGEIDADAPREQRMKQLAELMTSPDNGRLTRTMVNRLWARFMGRGLVEPVDEMDDQPWHEELLDWLAVDLMDNGYDLKRTIRLIVTSQAYQLPAVGMQDPSESDFTFRGPVVKRMSAEQFCDAVAQLTGISYTSAAPSISGAANMPGTWVWNDPDALKTAAAGEIYLRKIIELDDEPLQAALAAACDNECVVYVNGVEVGRSDDWKKPLQADIAEHLVKGRNLIAVAAKNFFVEDVSKNNPAAFRAAVSIQLPDDRLIEFGTDGSWQVATALPANLAFIDDADGDTWTAAAELSGDAKAYRQANAVLDRSQLPRNRAVWSKNDPLMLALGRPNREQVITYRPTAATTLEALELTNGQVLAERLERGARRWARLPAADDAERVRQLFYAAIGREPTAQELAVATEMVGSPASEEGFADLMWALVMMPEFQLIY